MVANTNVLIIRAHDNSCVSEYAEINEETILKGLFFVWLLLFALGCQSSLKKNNDKLRRQLPTAKDLVKLNWDELQLFKSSYISTPLFQPGESLSSNRIIFMPQSHSSHFMFIDKKSPEDSKAVLLNHKDPAGYLVDQARSQYLILNKLLFADLKDVVVLNEGSPDLNSVKFPVNDRLREKVESIFPVGFNAPFMELNQTQLQILAHVGAINLLYVLGKLDRIIGENQVCPQSAVIPQEPTLPVDKQLSSEQIFEALYVEPAGVQNIYDKHFRSHSPKPYKFWVIDREQRIGEKIRAMSEKLSKSTKLIMVFGFMHHFSTIKDFSISRFQESNDILKRVGFLKSQKLNEKSVPLTSDASFVIEHYLDLVWSSFNKGNCFSG